MTIQNARSNVAGNLPPGSIDGQFLINQADDVLFTHKPDGTTRRFLLPKRRGISDALISIGTTETYIGIASLTSARAVTLPPAANYPVGHALAVVDESGSVSPTVSLTLTPQGSDKVNGVSTLALTTAFSGVLLFSDGVSKWTAIALPAGGASNALLYVAQSITSGQQDQARANLSGAVAAFQSATTPLAALDFERDEYVTGTSTLTMPSAVAPGWRTGVITNDNALTGGVTLAVPTGHSLDGATNGVTALLPRQRARLRLVSAGAWRTDWVDRSPTILSRTISAAVASVDLPLPVGYGAFELSIAGLRVSATANLTGLFSSDGGGTFLNAANAYINTIVFGTSVGGSGTASYQVAAAASIAFGGTLAAGNTPYSGTGIVAPGSTTEQATVTMTAGHALSAGGLIGRNSFANYQGNLLMNALRIAVDAGTIVEGSIVLRGRA